MGCEPVAMLEVRDVTVSFGATTVLRQVSFNVVGGEIVALTGASGSGKSTLLRAIVGILTPDSGLISLDGHDITTVPTHQRNIGFVFQDEQLFPHRSVAENIAFGLRMQRWPKPRQAARVGELLEMVGLNGFETRRVTDLSGGEAKRVALARTLAPSPRLVLLDEPLTGLDKDLRDQLGGDLRQLLQETGTAAILVTHDRDEAAAVADRVVALADLSNDAEISGDSGEERV